MMDRKELIKKIIFVDHLIARCSPQHIIATEQSFNDYTMEELQKLAFFLGIDVSGRENDKQKDDANGGDWIVTEH